MAAILLSGAVSALAQPTLTAPVPNNLGAGQVTLSLQSSAAGTGYFALLEGATVAPGSGAQTKAALDANGAAAARFGSLPLAANTAGIYTVRNLKSGTKYTVCFTADDGATLQPMVKTVRFTTTGSASIEGKDWMRAGRAGFSAGNAWYTSLAFGPDGAPHAAYTDWGNEMRASVLRYTGNAWVPVGTAGFSASDAWYITLAIAPDGTPYVAFHDPSAGKRATVMKFWEGQWQVVGAAGFSASEIYSQLTLGFAPDGAPHLAYQDISAGYRATVMRFDGEDWAPVGGVGGSESDAACLTMGFAPDGTLYIGYKDFLPGIDGRATVKKYTGGAWSVVGTAGFSAGEADDTRMAIGPDGTVYMAYRDGTKSYALSAMRFAGGAWQQMGAVGFSGVGGAWTSLAVAPDGLLYLAFGDTDHVSGAGARVMRFRNEAWETVGTADFSASGATDNSLAFGPDGTPWLLYSDSSVGGWATLMTLADSSYADWAELNFSAAERTQPAICGAHADPEGCGVTNLLRYACDLAPHGAPGAPAAMVTVPSGGKQYLGLQFTRRRKAPGLDYVVESSTDLAKWSTVSTWAPAAVNPTVTARDSVALGAAARRFLRLRATETPAGLRVLVPAYFYPGAEWTRLANVAATTPMGTLFAIANVNNGPDSGQAADIAPYQQVIRDLRAKGGRVLGYVYTSYGARAVAAVKADIDLWYSRFGVDGIFLDEQANTSAALAYYQSLHDYIKAKGGEAFVVGNPGVATIEGYMAANDVTCVFETAGPTGFPTWTPPVWTAGYPASKFYVLPYNSSAADMAAYVTRAAANRAGWIYVTDDTLPNPWDTLPSYFETLVTTSMMAE